MMAAISGILYEDMDEHHLDALPPVDAQSKQNPSLPDSEPPLSTPHEKQTTTGLEKVPAGFVDPSSSAPGGLPALPPIPPLPPGTPAPAGAPDSTPPQVPSTPPIADDADLIEKEWVLKAKQ